jgi:Tol biopolymer transport system component
VDRDSEQAPNSIFLLDIETREKRKLTTPPSGSWDGLPAFSPDGGSLAFTRGHGRPLSDIYVLRLSDTGRPRAAPQRITYDNTFVFGLDWTADGRSIVFSSTRGGVWALWRVSPSGGEPERLPVGGNNAFWPSVSKRGNRLAYSEGVEDWNIWRVAAPGGGAMEDPAAAPIRISPSPQIDQSPAFSPDGRMIAWSSMHSGSHQIWVCNTDGSQPTQLTHLDPPGAAEPLWSPDGRQIAFNAYSRGPHNVYVIGADGGAARRLTTGDFDEDLYSWSRDGKWIYFGSNHGEGDALWKAPVSGGSPLLVASNGRGPAESLDGRFVYYSGPEASIWKVPASGGSPVRVARNGWEPVESFDGKFVYYSGPGASIWKVPAGGGEPAQVLKTGQRASWTLASAGIYVLDPDAKGGPSIELLPFNGQRTQIVRLPGKPDSYGRTARAPLRNDMSVSSISPDGRWILYVHVDRAEADIMLVENFR